VLYCILINHYNHYYNRQSLSLLLKFLKSILWINRRNEKDVVDLYNSLTPFVQLALADPNNHMLNFGYWTPSITTPLEAQLELCRVVGEFANLHSAKKVVDIGSGFCAPAMLWKAMYNNLDIVCVDINSKQLTAALKKITLPIATAIAKSDQFYVVNKNVEQTNSISLVNAAATRLPFADNCVDRLIALESAQHFKRLARFLRECRRVLTPKGLLVVAIPILGPNLSNQSLIRQISRLGILYFTWASEHYSLEKIESAIVTEGFEIQDIQHIGHSVYEPSANYYIQNRQVLRQRLRTNTLPHAKSLLIDFVERLVYISTLKMKDSSQKEIIDYILIKAATDNNNNNNINKPSNHHKGTDTLTPPPLTTDQGTQ
jgi:ubiquinone/menaquinone biosynthesis C-methylase UbiE